MALAGPTPGYSPHSYYYPQYYNGYQCTYGYGPYYRPTSYWGFSWGWGGGFSISFGSGWYGGWNFGLGWGHGSGVYFGAFATAYLVGHAWHILPYQGSWGYYGGSNCYWIPHSHWGHNSSFWYGGHYCRVNQPYWYSYSRWYDYRPYGYGYSSLVYDDLYDDGFDDGYDRGYNRGYNDGAEEASGLKDDRRRDSIGPAARPRVPDSGADRAKGSAVVEFRREMKRGADALGQADFVAATKAFKEAAILDPESADARYMLSVSALAEGKYAFSAFALRRAMALDPEGSNLDLVRMFGTPEAVKAQRDRLHADMQKSPEDEDMLLLKGFTALRSGDARTAAEALDKLVGLNPQDKAAARLHKEALERLENE